VEGPHRQGGLRPARPVAAARVLFPVAAAYALLVLPASVMPMLGVAPRVPGLASPAAHAHEMLFGFALLVVAGHQLGQVGGRRLALLLALWVAARASFLAAPASALAVLANIAFAFVLGLGVAPRLAKSAKKLRNLALPAVLAALTTCAAAVELARAAGAVAIERTLLTVAVIAFSLLMLFMGGRLIAPAAAGQFHRQGANLAARVQPRLEAALIVALLAAVVGAAFPARSIVADAGAALLVAGGLVAAARLVRWRLWAMRGRPDLACIGIGYAWVAAGLAAWGASLLARSHALALLHAITVGGLGTLTFNVMALTWARLDRADPGVGASVPLGTALIAAACVARIAADFAVDARLALLALAAGCWSAAFLLLLARFALLRRRTARA
jgi:uncharacterized protein involved in response to NO